MFEQTNQTEQEQAWDITPGMMEESLVDEDGAGAPPVLQETAQSAAGEEEVPFALEVKYNGETHSLGREEAQTLAQKGMNYDHVFAELLRLRGAKGTGLIDRYARAAGMDRETYLARLDEQLRESETQRYTKEGVPEEYAGRLAALETAQSAEADADEQRIGQWMSFFAENPQIKDYMELPEEVREDIGRGTDPSLAYIRHENMRLKNQLAENEAKQSREGSFPISASGDSDNEGGDEFARAFMRALKD